MTNKREELERLFETAWQDGFRCSGNQDYKKRTQLLTDQAMKMLDQMCKEIIGEDEILDLKLGQKIDFNELNEELTRKSIRNELLQEQRNKLKEKQ